MSLLEAILLGIIQGATEFLPISSSGHLILVPSLLGWGQPNLRLVSIAHLGSLLAVLIYFRSDLFQIIRGVLSGLWTRAPFGNPDARLGWLILLGTIPAALVGLTFQDFFDEVFGTPRVAAIFLLVTAGLLVAGERLLRGNKQMRDLNWRDALIVGTFQMFALMPGVSRSGSTIAGGLWRGLDREIAARFSFLLGIPAILGAGLLAVVELLGSNGDGQGFVTYAATFLAAAISGYLCIYFLLAWLRERTLYPFAIYCALFGLSYLALSFLGVV